MPDTALVEVTLAALDEARGRPLANVHVGERESVCHRTRQERHEAEDNITAFVTLILVSIQKIPRNDALPQVVPYRESLSIRPPSRALSKALKSGMTHNLGLFYRQGDHSCTRC